MRKIALAFSQVLIISLLSNSVIGQSTYLDPSFSSDGITMLDLGTDYEIASEVLLQDDGKIIGVAEKQSSANAFLNIVFRLNTDGSLDTSFGSSGGIQPDFLQTNSNFAARVAITTGSTFVLAGRSASGLGNDATVAKYTNAGNLDTSFDTDGVNNTTIFANETDFAAIDEIVDLLVLDDGSLVTLGMIEWQQSGVGTVPHDDTGPFLAVYSSTGSGPTARVEDRDLDPT